MITLKRTTLVRVGVASLAVAALSGSAFANQHPHPHKGSLDYLDRNSYAHNMRVLGVFQLGEERGHKLQMMAIGPRRFILQNGDVIDVSDPRVPKLVKPGAFRGSQLQVAFNKKLGKWILITGASSPITSTTATAPNGKYDDPSLIDKTKQGQGLRGIRIWDATDPTNIGLLSEFSTDGGDPKRKVQTGSGTHRNYYDGGDYAYLDTAPDDSFTHMESPIRWHGNGIMVVDVSDPSNPKQVAMWWVPGQRTGEEAQYKAWREYGDKVSFTSLHGPMYVPTKVEDGGKLGYSAYGSFGMLIHELRVADIREVVDQHAERTVGAVAEVAAVLHFCLHGHRTVPAGVGVIAAAVVIVAVRSRAGLDLALGIAAVGGELREQAYIGGIGRIPDADAAQTLALLGLIDQARVIVLAVGGRRRGRSDRRGCPGDQDPLAEFLVERDLELRASERSGLHELRHPRVADIDHVAVLQDEAARADRHHLQLVAALLAELEHAEHAHVVCVAVAVEIVEASLVRVRMLVCKGAAGQRGDRERGDADANEGGALECDHGSLPMKRTLATETRQIDESIESVPCELQKPPCARRIPAAVSGVGSELALDLFARERFMHAAADVRLALFEHAAVTEGHLDVAGVSLRIRIARIDDVTHFGGEREDARVAHRFRAGRIGPGARGPEGNRHGERGGGLRGIVVRGPVLG